MLCWKFVWVPGASRLNTCSFGLGIYFYMNDLFGLVRLCVILFEFGIISEALHDSETNCRQYQRMSLHHTEEG